MKCEEGLEAEEPLLFKGEMEDEVPSKTKGQLECQEESQRHCCEEKGLSTAEPVLLC